MTIYSTLTAPLSAATNAAQTVSNGTLQFTKDSMVSLGSVVANVDMVSKMLENGLTRGMEKYIKHGQLTLIMPSNKSYAFGPGQGAESRQRQSLDAGKGHPRAHELKQKAFNATKYHSSGSSCSTTYSGATSDGGETSGVSTPPTSVDASPRKHVSALQLSYADVTKVGLEHEQDHEAAQEACSPDGPVPHVTIRVHSSTFFLRLMLSGDLGFAESYMAGECDVYLTEGQGAGQALDEAYYGEITKNARGETRGEELLQLFQIAIRSDHPAECSSYDANKSEQSSKTSSAIASGLNSLPATLFSAIGSYTMNSRWVNSVRNSVGNIKAHYDISNRMFASFLSDDMTYSCAIFPTLDGDLTSSHSSSSNKFNPAYLPLTESTSKPTDTRSSDDLETAQYAKLHHIIRKARIQRGHRVLEIGSGWGSMAIEMVRLTGCTVDTLTLSTEQKRLAEERIRDAGFQDSITVHLMDFRSIPESWHHTYDRVVSIEMLEAVGKEYIAPYFQMMDDVLNEHGVACFQVITIPESRFESYSNSVDFIQKYIFPGGFLPSVSYTTEMIKTGSRGRLTVDSMQNIGPHYARTLREWRLRFLAHFDRDIRPALRDEHPEMSEKDVEVFKRKWIYYFVYCEIGFTERLINDHIFTLTREGNREMGCNVFA